ncbi:hypothetical protein JCM1840_005982 [Sporobolomyces johnsonii]
MARGSGKNTPRRTPIDDDFSPSSPSPASPSHSNSGTPRRSTTPASTASPARTLSLQQDPPKPTRGPLPPSAETTYHQRLKAILADHKKARRQWNELVIRGLVGRVRAAIELWVDVETALKLVEQKSPTAGAVKAGYLFAQSAKLSDQLAAVEAVFTSLTELHQSMTYLVERAEWLVVEAAKTRGTLFAFREPLWVTWPLARFADGLADLTTPYTSSLALIRTLLDTLTTFPSLPSASLPSDSSRSAASTPGRKDDRPRPSSEQLQASLSLLAVQPLLPGKQGDWGSEGWEEMMAAEVGGWGEK